MPNQRKKKPASDPRSDPRLTESGGGSNASPPPLTDERPRSDEAIQLRAYQLYTERGRHEGDAEADRLQAEREYGDGRVREEEGRQGEGNA